MNSTATFPGPRKIKVESFGERQQIWVPVEDEDIDFLLALISEATGVHRTRDDFTDPDEADPVLMPDDLGSFLITIWNYLLVRTMGADRTFNPAREDELRLLTNYLDPLIGETEGEMDL